jgi:hypothetical protein
MPRNRWSTSCLLSLVALAGLVGGWVWSHVRGAPDAYIEVIEAGKREQHFRETIFNDHPMMLDLLAKRQQSAVELKVRAIELQSRAQAAAAQRAQKRPFHWVRCGTWGDSTLLMVSSRGRVGFVSCHVRATSRASGKAKLVAPGYWQIDGDTVLLGRPELRTGRLHQVGMNVNGWAIAVTSFGGPYWALCLVALVAPSWRLVGWARKRRLIASNRCASCGYDLRASPNRCPECGAERRPATPPVDR